MRKKGFSIPYDFLSNRLCILEVDMAGEGTDSEIRNNLLKLIKRLDK
jgi:hypothetical protein